MTEEVTTETETADKTEVTQTASLLDGVEDAPDYKPLEIKEGEKPEGLADEYWDIEKKVINIDAMNKALQEAQTRAKGLRDKLAKGADKAPKDEKEYVFKPSEKGKAMIRGDDDPVIAAARKIAKEAGISKEAFAKFIPGMADALADLVGQQAKPPELTPEQVKEIKTKEFAKIGPNGEAVAKAVASFGNEMRAIGLFSEDDLKVFRNMAQTGEDIRVLNKLRYKVTGTQDIPMDAQTDGLPSDAEIAKMIGSKAYISGDPTLHAKVAELLNKRREAGRPEKLQF